VGAEIWGKEVPGKEKKTQVKRLSHSEGRVGAKLGAKNLLEVVVGGGEGGPQKESGELRSRSPRCAEKPFGKVAT